MTTFFIPGIGGDPHSAEDAYDEMRRQIELELGRAPSARRIFRLWTRRGSTVCITEVGRREPLHGGTVIAIFEIGAAHPFVVCRQQDLGSRDGIREILECDAYSLLEFEA